MATMDDLAGYGAGLLSGRLVRLRALTEDDLPELVRWWSDPGWAVLQQGTVRPRPEADVAAMFRSWSANTAPGDAGFSVETFGDELVGHVTLYGGAEPARAATAAIIVGPAHVGRGYGSDALRVLLRYGFHELGLDRVEIRAWAFNERALAAYRRVGFVEEGRRREVLLHDGVRHDEVILSVLRREWRTD